MRTSQKITGIVTTIGIGRNTFHLVGFDQRGAIILQQKVTAHECSIRTQCLRSPAGRIESWRRGAGSRSPTIGRHALR
jgi:hypothetical protein